MGQVSICSPQGFAYRAILRCRKCKRRTRHIIRTYVWYDPTMKCLAHEVRVPYSYRLSPGRADALWRGASTRAEAHAAVVAAAMAELDAV